MRFEYYKVAHFNKIKNKTPVYINCHTYYSLKYGTMSPEQLLADAKQKGVSCLAVTDINTTSGILDFARLAPRYQIKPVIGIEYRNSPPLQGRGAGGEAFIGIAKNNEGFYELNKFLTQCLASGEMETPETIPMFENL